MTNHRAPLVATGLNQTYAFFADRAWETAIERVDHSMRLQIEVIALHRGGPEQQLGAGQEPIPDNAPRLVVITNTHAKESYFLDEDIRTPGAHRYNPEAPIAQPSAFQAVGYLVAAKSGVDVNLNDILSDYEAEATHRFSQGGQVTSLPSFIDETESNIACAVIKLNQAEAEHLLAWARHGHDLDAHQLTPAVPTHSSNGNLPPIRNEIFSAIRHWADISLRSLGLDSARDDAMSPIRQQAQQESDAFSASLLIQGPPNAHQMRDNKREFRCR